jgi:predicted alpha/beta-fold hydrolase
VGLDVVLETEAMFKKGIEVDEAIRQRKDYVKNLPPQIRYMQAAEESELLSSNDDRPMLIALHGLSGGSHESYVRAVLHHIMKLPSRWTACSLNSRGCGRTAITTQQLFCANWTGTSNFLLHDSLPQRISGQRWNFSRADFQIDDFTPSDSL